MEGLNELRKGINKNDNIINTAAYFCGGTSAMHKMSKLSDEEQFKYTDIAKKSFMKLQVLPVREELQAVLKPLSRGYDAAAAGAVSSLIAETGICTFVFNGMYDIPEKTEDKIKTGESGDVFVFTCVSVCPLKLSKPGLSFNDKAIIVDGRRLMVSPPKASFIYPAFVGRSADYDHALVMYDSFLSPFFDKPAPDKPVSDKSAPDMSVPDKSVPDITGGVADTVAAGRPVAGRPVAGAPVASIKEISTVNVATGNAASGGTVPCSTPTGSSTSADGTGNVPAAEDMPNNRIQIVNGYVMIPLSDVPDLAALKAYLRSHA